MRVSDDKDKKSIATFELIAGIFFCLLSIVYFIYNENRNNVAYAIIILQLLFGILLIVIGSSQLKKVEK